LWSSSAPAFDRTVFVVAPQFLSTEWRTVRPGVCGAETPAFGAKTGGLAVFHWDYLVWGFFHLSPGTDALAWAAVGVEISIAKLASAREQ